MSKEDKINFPYIVTAKITTDISKRIDRISKDEERPKQVVINRLLTKAVHDYEIEHNITKNS